MSNYIVSAAKGNRKAMEQLYNETKKSVYSLTKCFLKKESSAEEVTARIFKRTWPCLKDYTIQNEVDLELFFQRKTIEYCRKYLLSKDSNAFKNPKDKNFHILVEKAQGEELLLLFSETIEKSKSLENEIDVPESVDKSVAKSIDDYATPIEKKKTRRFVTVAVSIVVSVFLLSAVAGITYMIGTKDNGEDTAEDPETNEYLLTEPVIDLDEEASYYADIEVENYGTITVELAQNEAPITVANFVNLADQGFYDGLTFHRIMDGSFMQGGDPNGDGTGDSTYNIVGEFSDNGYQNSLPHTRGAISMARATDYNSGSCQFFICQEDCSDSFDGYYAAFGYVTEGMEIVDAICGDSNPTDSNGTIPTDEQPIITSITIRIEYPEQTE